MRSYKAELPKLFSKKDSVEFTQDCSTFVNQLNSKDLGQLFVDVGFLVSGMQFVKEQHWLQNQGGSEKVLFNIFIKKFFKFELTPILFLHEFLEKSSIEGIVQIAEQAALIQKNAIEQIKSRNYIEQKVAVTIILQLMSDLFEFEHQLNLQKKEAGKEISLSLYRTFDALDEILELNYIKDEIFSAPAKERLYQGAGLGVQSSYATTLMALRYLNLPRGGRFIDLGSGYGRIGLVVGLLRHDVDFTGYEFVDARVQIASHASTNLGLNQHVHFVTQDLSATDFSIPPADAYYIFDSFSDDTYQHVLGQLTKIAAQKNIVVITKGNARLWFKGASWSQPQEFNDGNLCLFRSTGRTRANAS